jgi:UDP-N-acetylglucosamine 2-epimerase (non-hydrolysing)
MTRRVMHVVGARPNFMKVAPIIKALERTGMTQLLVHTGQHYDRAMSELFFDELGLPRPDINLGIGSGSHGEQTGRIMAAFEPVLEAERPDLVVVVGDVNSTLACAIDAKKLNIQVAHVEAGLRSGDMEMPEEINRIVTDSVSDLLFATDRIARENLLAQGIPPESIHLVGNVMIDSLLEHREKALSRPTLDQLGLRGADGAAVAYVVVTLHRPSNVDVPERLAGIVQALEQVAQEATVVFPVHPRTRRRLTDRGFGQRLERQGVQLIDPLGYLDFLNLNANAQAVITDSGGIQEETTILGVPCLTLRENTERPITIEQGTNHLIGTEPGRIVEAFRDVRHETGAKGVPELWDGKAAERIAQIIMRRFEGTTPNGFPARGR